MNFIKSKTIFNGSHSDEIEKKGMLRGGHFQVNTMMMIIHMCYMMKCLFVCLWPSEIKTSRIANAVQGTLLLSVTNPQCHDTSVSIC